MKRVLKPNFNAKDTFHICISIVRDKDLKSRLLECENLIIKAEVEFDSKVTTGEVYTIAKEKIVNGNVTANELEKVYTQRMSTKDVPGRTIYDKLMSASTLGICPLCNHRIVETLDHYLPKSEFPRLAVTPINLIPSCYTCNKSKLANSPTKPEEETFHPYFDNIEDDEWLSAIVNKTTPPSVSFFVKAPNEWSDLLAKRVNHHFISFSLNKLYSTHAAVLIRNLHGRLNSIYNSFGANGVQKYLEEEAKSRINIDKNSWQTAFYKAISNDIWFCDQGYKIN